MTLMFTYRKQKTPMWNQVIVFTITLCSGGTDNVRVTIVAYEKQQVLHILRLCL